MVNATRKSTTLPNEKAPRCHFDVFHEGEWSRDVPWARFCKLPTEWTFDFAWCNYFCDWAFSVELISL